MRMDFADILQLYPGVHQQVLPDLQIDLSNDPQIALLQQIVIRKNAAGDGILNGHHSPIAFFAAGRAPDRLPERSTRHYGYILPKELLRRDLMKTAFIALYRNFYAPGP